MYSIVLPINIKSGNGPQFSEIGLPSYEKFLDLKNLHTFYLISPEKDIMYLKTITKNSKIPFKYINEIYFFLMKLKTILDGLNSRF